VAKLRVLPMNLIKHRPDGLPPQNSQNGAALLLHGQFTCHNWSIKPRASPPLLPAKLLINIHLLWQAGFL
jgi:hypothetical protein